MELTAIKTALDNQMRVAAALWAGFTVFSGVMLTFALHELAVFVGTALVAAVVYGLIRFIGSTHSMLTATVQQKFITRKKRREYVVLGSHSYRVHRALYDRMKVGERYRIHTNGCGGVVFDLVV